MWIVALISIVIIVLALAFLAYKRFTGSDLTATTGKSSILDSLFSNVTPSTTVQEVFNSIQARTPQIIIDVRSQEEYGTGIIPNAINIPLEVIVGTGIESVVPDKNTRILLYCRTGKRSANATRHLRSKGYQNAFNVTGGIVTWATSFPMQAVVQSPPQMQSV